MCEKDFFHESVHGFARFARSALCELQKSPRIRTNYSGPRRPCIRNPYSRSAREWVAYLPQGVTRMRWRSRRGMAWQGNQTEHLFRLP